VFQKARLINWTSCACLRGNARQPHSVASATASLFELAGMTDEATLDETSVEHSHDLLQQLEAVARASGDGYEPETTFEEEEEPRRRGRSVVPSAMHPEQEGGAQPRDVFTSSCASPFLQKQTSFGTFSSVAAFIFNLFSGRFNVCMLIVLHVIHFSISSFGIHSL
jgi:hypothetical protein